MKQPVEIQLSKLAEIALSSLPERTLKQFENSISILHDNFKSSHLHGKLYKFRNPLGESIFTLKIGSKYRAILKVDGSLITVVDIVNHSELRKLFGKGGKYA